MNQRHIQFAPPPENYKAEETMKKSFIQAMLSTTFAYAAPYLFLARQVDATTSVGSTMTTEVSNITSIPLDNGNIVKIELKTSVSIQKTTESQNTIIYTFRGMSSNVFEPFVMISRTKQSKNFFAYATETQFLLGLAEEDDISVLKNIYSEAKKNEMYILTRYMNLLINR